VIYASDYMINLMKLVNKVTMVDSTVMITGESGTGKGLIARYIHENSGRSDEKMIEINCSAIPDTLFESELFGYESGAFTGAQKGGKPGIIEMANRGTLLLDEIGDMPIHMQVKLLKVLQDRKVTRVGSIKPIDIDVRIIAATNKDLKKLIEEGLFRTDLYYRLNVFPISIAPLRERKEDIYTLLQHFLLYYNRKHNNKVTLTQNAQDKIVNYRWPGNVRELEHFIERLVIIEEGIVDARDIEMEQDFEAEKTGVKVNRILPLKEAVNETEKQLIDMAMKISQNSYEVADILGISQANAYRKMKKYKV
jgi:transcriptional regulator with PAS, ATPase and Fis domain